MKTVDNYCDRAKRVHNIPSDRQLGIALGLKPAAVNSWRTKRAWPSDDTMESLARLAQEDPSEALLWLNVWRTSGVTKSRYIHIAEMFAAGALSLLILLSSLSAVQARTTGEQVNVVKSGYFILWKEILSRLKAMFSRIFYASKLPNARAA